MVFYDSVTSKGEFLNVRVFKNIECLCVQITAYVPSDSSKHMCKCLQEEGEDCNFLMCSNGICNLKCNPMHDYSELSSWWSVQYPGLLL